jgi:hypothetical protein
MAYALGAATAIALAKLSNANIVDDNEVWTDNYEIAPDKLMEILRVRQEQPNIGKAATELARHMNKH